ncbi:hypothetical protein NGRA_0474 [Nosema granulosis]|uniref:ATP-dependent DNA helicase n=1 Tax=Nosema granulosis TaxID=83296 RepID=A0A9P6H3H8_9MICR|nr:hypothetical protein NGRA_0474 [Nosema granulosis]
MMPKHALDAIDEVLKRYLHSNDIFSGTIVLLGGDFRQTSNIVLKGTLIVIIEISLLSARTWRHVRVLSQSANMRSMNQDMFADWLLTIRNDSSNDRENLVSIPDEYVEKGDLVESIFDSEMIRFSARSS